MFLVRGVVRGIFPLAPSHFSNGKLSFLSKKNIKKHIFSNIFVQKTYKNMFFSGILGLPVCPVIFKTGIPVLKITGQTGSPKIPEKNMFFGVFQKQNNVFELDGTRKLCFLLFFLFLNTCVL